MSPGLTWNSRKPPRSARTHLVFSMTTWYSGRTGCSSSIPRWESTFFTPRTVALDDPGLHLPDLAAFHHDRGASGSAGLGAEGLSRSFAVDDDLAAKRLRKLSHRGKPQVASNVRVVGAANGGGMQIDSVIASHHDGIEDRMSHPGRETSGFRSGKTAVQVAAIGKIARVPIEAQQVQDGNEYDRSPDQLKVVVLEQLPNGAGAVDLIAVQARPSRTRRGRRPSPPDMNRDLHRHTAVALADGQRDVACLAGGDSSAIPGIDRLASTRCGHRCDGCYEDATVID